MARSAGPRNSDATKEAIKSAARKQFAEHGFQRATMRAIASDAGIDPAMIIRYFTNKDELFVAVADFDLRMPDLSVGPVRTRGASMAKHFVDRWEEDETFTALLRAAVTHQVANDRLQRIFYEQIIDIVATLIADKDSAPARAGLIASQLYGTALCRYVLMIQPVVDMPRAELVSWLGGTLQRYLTK